MNDGNGYQLVDPHGKELSLFEAVYQSVGAASVCWENIESAGTFKNEEAAMVAKALLRFIEDRYVPREEVTQ